VNIFSPISHKQFKVLGCESTELASAIGKVFVNAGVGERR
jgi:hypothetical protein